MKFTSPVFSAVSGSIAGVTYSHNRGGMYTRARAVPTNPNSIRQQERRSAFNSAVQAWSSELTPAQRAGWSVYAANVPVTNKLGQTVHLSGQQMFIRAYAFYMQPALAAVLGTSPKEPPVIFDTGQSVWQIEDTSTAAPNNLGIAGTLGADMDTTFALTGPADDAGVLVIYRGPAVNPGVNFYKGPYRLDKAILIPPTDDTVDWATTQVTNLSGYPAMAQDQRIPIRARILWEDGRLSEPYAAVLPVTDNSTP